MKKLFITCIFLTICNLSFCQRFIGTAIAGINCTQVDGDEVYGFRKVGFVGGASVMLALDNKQQWFATLELLYSQKGSKSKQYFDTTAYAPVMFQDVDRSYPFQSNVKCHLKLDYVEVPVIFHYEDPRTGCAFGVGASWGRLINAQETYNGFRRYTSINSNTYSKNEWSVIGEVKFRIYKGLKINFRYQYTFIPIRKITFVTLRTNGSVMSEDRNQYHNMFSIRLSYSFNERYKLNGKTDKKGNKKGPKWVRDISMPN